MELVPGANQEIPYFVAKGLFEFNRPKNIKSLEKQLQEIAPKGQKRIWRAQASELFSKIAELNVEVPVEPSGKFIGEVGETITFPLKSLKLVHSHNWVFDWSWRHNGHGWEHPSGTKCMWKFVDYDNNVYMFSSSGEVTNNKISNITTGSAIEAVVESHKVFGNVRQTWIKKIKPNPGLFGLLS